MARFILLLFLLFCLNNNTVFCQRIAWQDSTFLTWDDFQGRKPRKTKFASATFSSIVMTFGKDSVNGSITANAICLFDPKMSWKIHKNLKGYVLKHEQSHFDISEIYARKIRKAIAEYRQRPDATYDDPGPYNRIYKKYSKQLNRYQNKYDRQTRHSLRKGEQHAWNVRIANELKSLETYKLPG